MALTIENFIKISMENPINAEIISKLHTLGLD